MFLFFTSQSDKGSERGNEFCRKGIYTSLWRVAKKVNSETTKGWETLKLEFDCHVWTPKLSNLNWKSQSRLQRSIEILQFSKCHSDKYNQRYTSPSNSIFAHSSNLSQCSKKMYTSINTWKRNFSKSSHFPPFFSQNDKCSEKDIEISRKRFKIWTNFWD